MFETVKILNMKTILVISFCVFLTKGLPTPEPQADQDEQEIKLSASPTVEHVDCKTATDKDTVVWCAHVSICFIYNSFT